jgi:hypothetical protein
MKAKMNNNKMIADRSNKMKINHSLNKMPIQENLIKT